MFHTKYVIQVFNHELHEFRLRTNTIFISRYAMQPVTPRLVSRAVRMAITV